MQPETIPYFDDNPSYFHGVLGIVTSRLPNHIQALVGLGFILYQMKEVEPFDNKFGDFAEFVTGWLVGEGLK